MGSRSYKNLKELSRFLEMVIYVSKLIPTLSIHSLKLRELTKTNVIFE